MKRLIESYNPYEVENEPVKSEVMAATPRDYKVWISDQDAINMQYKGHWYI